MNALAVVALAVAVLAAVRGLWSPCGLSMVSALNPLAERARGHRWPLTVVWHVAGATAGGAGLGLGCAAAAYLYGRLELPATASWSILAGGAALTLAADLRLGVRLPGRPRQVDQRWITTYRRWVYAAGFGAQIGVGFATYVMTAATYLVPLLAVLTGSPAAGLLVGVTYGATRGLMLLLATGASTPERLRARLSAAERWSGRSMRAVEAAQLAVLTAAAAAFPPAGIMVAGCLVVVAGVRLRGPSAAATLPPARAIR